MTMLETVRFVRDTLQKAPALAFLQDDKVLLGDRKHGDDLTEYEVTVMPVSEEELASSATFRSHDVRHGSGLPRSSGTKTVRYRIGLDLWCRKTDPNARILGTDPRSPGILEFVRIVKDTFERGWRFKKSIMALEFENTTYIEAFPPPKAQILLMIEEQIAVEDRALDPVVQQVGQDPREA